MKTLLICVAQVLLLAGCQAPWGSGERGARLRDPAAEVEAVLVAAMEGHLQHYLDGEEVHEQYVIDAVPAVLDQFRTRYAAKMVVSPAEQRQRAFQVPGAMVVRVRHIIILGADGRHAWVKLRNEVSPRAAVFYLITLKRSWDGSWRAVRSVCGPGAWAD